jgi:hypothetical protein
MSYNDPTFPVRCRRVLEPVLEQFGYAYTCCFTRPRGVVVEFSKGHNSLFAVNEGDVLYVDLILSDGDTNHRRISLNQALWFSGTRSLIGLTSIDEQLAKFVDEATHSICVVALLNDCLEQFDPRFCFEMTTQNWLSYLQRQRGKALE